jgi:hypothetical protein
MPRQNYLSRETFVKATENQTREILLTIPATLNHVRYIGENKLNSSIRFSYKQQEKNREYHLEVSILPLDEQYTRLCLHARYINGDSFYTDTDMAVALHDFEGAVHAAVKGELFRYIPYTPKPSFRKKVISIMSNLPSFPNLIFLRKKLS